MAHATIVQLIDDLDGSTGEDIETVTFGLDGVTYEIDLNEDNAGNLRDQSAEFVEAAKRTGGRARRSTSTTKRSGSARNREQTQAIREWARQNDWEIADRGRIPAKIIEAYKQAQTGTKRQK